MTQYCSGLLKVFSVVCAATCACETLWSMQRGPGSEEDWVLVAAPYHTDHFALKKRLMQSNGARQPVLRGCLQDIFHQDFAPLLDTGEQAKIAQRLVTLDQAFIYRMTGCARLPLASELLNDSLLVGGSCSSAQISVVCVKVRFGTLYGMAIGCCVQGAAAKHVLYTVKDLKVSEKQMHANQALDLRPWHHFLKVNLRFLRQKWHTQIYARDTNEPTANCYCQEETKFSTRQSSVL